MPAAAALLLLAPASQSRAQAQAAQATPAPTQSANPAPASPSQTTVAATHPSAEQRGITARAIDKVKQVAKSAGDIFSRVPRLASKGGSKAMGSLPHVAASSSPDSPS